MKSGQLERSITTFVGLAVMAVSASHAQTSGVVAQDHGPVTFAKQVHHDRSRSLREIQPVSSSSHPTRLSLPVPSGRVRQPKDPSASVAPPEVNGGSGVTTNLGLNEAGLGLGFTGPDGTFNPTVNPSDATGAVGTTQYFQWVNDSFAVFDKATGNALIGPLPGNTLWSNFGGPCEADNDGQPTVNFDKLSNTWVVSQYAITGGPPYLQCIAVSTSADATGTWNRYAFAMGGNGITPPWINQNAKLGVWPDAYYMSFDMYNGTTFTGDLLSAFQRQNMLNGASAGMQCFQMDPEYFGIVVSDLDSATPPPSGAPAYFATDDRTSSPSTCGSSVVS
jgi:hypothetical protein